eukprot:10385655-Alexandrium_andersonii.AAC.1
MKHKIGNDHADLCAEFGRTMQGPWAHMWAWLQKGEAKLVGFAKRVHDTTLGIMLEMIRLRGDP